MSDKMEIYYFSPTGGTKKVSDIFAAAVGKDVVWHDLRDKQTPTKQPQGELIIVAAPVFAGRIPSVVREKIKTLAGEGKKAVTIAVYGNRAYEDALLEMNVAAAPLSLPTCTSCGACAKICPTDAISNMDGKMATDAAKCILCMACIHACPKQARILPPPLQEKTDNMLAAFKAARNKNETFF